MYNNIIHLSLLPIWKDIFSLIDHLDGLVKGLINDYDDLIIMIMMIMMIAMWWL